MSLVILSLLNILAILVTTIYNFKLTKAPFHQCPTVFWISRQWENKKEEIDESKKDKFSQLTVFTFPHFLQARRAK